MIIIRVEMPCQAALAALVAARLTRINTTGDPASQKFYVNLMHIIEASAGKVLSAASSMQFELHWPEGIPLDVRQTMTAQLESEMRDQIVRTICAQATELLAFQGETIATVLNTAAQFIKDKAKA